MSDGRLLDDDLSDIEKIQAVDLDSAIKRDARRSGFTLDLLDDDSVVAESGIIAEARAYNEERAKLDGLRLANEALALDIKLRGLVAIVVVFLVGWWTYSVLDIVRDVGGKTLELSDTTIGVLLGTISANIIALLTFVVRYLFPQKDK